MGQLEEMTTFIRVVEAGGISKASEQLGVAKSAVSRRLAELEQRVGVTLLSRTTRSISLTDVGGRYYQRAVQILDDVAELNHLSSDQNKALSGELRLSVPVSFGLLHLSAALNEFLDSHPNLNLDLRFSDRPIDLIEEGVDLAIRIGSLPDSSLQARRITLIKMGLYAAPSYLAEYGEPKSWAELADHKLLQYMGSGPNSWRATSPSGKQESLNLHPNVKADNGEFLMQMAEAGRGIAYSPTFIAWRAAKEGRVVPVLSDYTVNQHEAYAVYPQNRFLSSRARALIDFLAGRFGDAPYWDEISPS